MNTRYTELAHELTIVEYLRQHMLDTFIDGPKELICELLPGRLRYVPKESIVDMLERLTLEKSQIEHELKQYDFVKREPRPLARAKGSEADDSEQREQAEAEAEEGEAASNDGDDVPADEGDVEADPADGSDADPEYKDLSGDDIVDGYPPVPPDPKTPHERNRFRLG